MAQTQHNGKHKLDPLTMVVKQKKERKIIDPVAGKKPIRIDEKTTVFVKASATQEEIDNIVIAYQVRTERRKAHL